MNSNQLKAVLDELLSWIKLQSINPNEIIEILLPPEFMQLSADGKIVLLKISNSIYFLIKTDVGWKENFNGILGCDNFFEETLFHRISDGRIMISIFSNSIFEELYLKRKLSNQFAIVFFDLN